MHKLLIFIFCFSASLMMAHDHAHTDDGACCGPTPYRIAKPNRDNRHMRIFEAVEIARYDALRELAGLAVDTDFSDDKNPRYLEALAKQNAILDKVLRKHYKINTPVPITDTEKAQARTIKLDVDSFRIFEHEKLEKQFTDPRKEVKQDALVRLTEYFKQRYGDPVADEAVIDADFAEFWKNYRPYPIVDPASLDSDFLLATAPDGDKMRYYRMSKKPLRLAMEVGGVHAMQDRVKNTWFEYVPLNEINGAPYMQMENEVVIPTMVAYFGLSISGPTSDSEIPAYDRAKAIYQSLTRVMDSHVLATYDVDKDGFFDPIEMEAFTRFYAELPEHPERMKKLTLELLKQAEAVYDKENKK